MHACRNVKQRFHGFLVVTRKRDDGNRLANERCLESSSTGLIAFSISLRRAKKKHKTLHTDTHGVASLISKCRFYTCAMHAFQDIPSSRVTVIILPCLLSLNNVVRPLSLSLFFLSTNHGLFERHKGVPQILGTDRGTGHV